MGSQSSPRPWLCIWWVKDLYSCARSYNHFTPFLTTSLFPMKVLWMCPLVRWLLKPNRITKSDLFTLLRQHYLSSSFTPCCPQARFSSVLPLLILGLCSIVGAAATFFLPETAGRWVLTANQSEACILTIDQSQDPAPDPGGWVTIRKRSIQVRKRHLLFFNPLKSNANMFRFECFCVKRNARSETDVESKIADEPGAWASLGKISIVLCQYIRSVKKPS